MHYYTILLEGDRTIREGVLIEGGALTEVVRYVIHLILENGDLNLHSFL